MTVAATSRDPVAAVQAQRLLWAEMAEGDDEDMPEESLWEEGLRAIELEAHLGPELMTAAEFGNQAQVRAVPLCIHTLCCDCFS